MLPQPRDVCCWVKSGSRVSAAVRTARTGRPYLGQKSGLALHWRRSDNRHGIGKELSCRDGHMKLEGGAAGLIGVADKLGIEERADWIGGKFRRGHHPFFRF